MGSLRLISWKFLAIVTPKRSNEFHDSNSTLFFNQLFIGDFVLDRVQLAQERTSSHKAFEAFASANERRRCSDAIVSDQRWFGGFYWCS